MKISVFNHIRESIGVAETVAFAVPEVGPMIAAGLSGLDFLFSLIAKPTAPPVSSNPPGLSEADKDWFRNAIALENDKQTMELELDPVVSMVKNLFDHWNLIETDMKSWDAVKLRDLGTAPGWKKLIVRDQSDFLSSDNPITIIINKAMEIPDKENSLPIFIYGVNAFILMARICLIGEYGLQQFNHELIQARANLKATIDAENKEDGGDSSSDLATGILNAIHHGKIDPTANKPQVPKNVRDSAVDVIKAMPTRDMVAQASMYARYLKLQIDNWHGYLRDLLIVPEAVQKQFDTAMKIVDFNIRISNDKKRGVVRLTAPGESGRDLYRLNHASMQDWVVHMWKYIVRGQFFVYMQETTFFKGTYWDYESGEMKDALGVLDLTEEERAELENAEKIYSDMSISTANALLNYTQADALGQHPDVDRAIKLLF